MRLNHISPVFAILLAAIATYASAQPTPSGGFLGLEMKLIPVASTGTTIGLALRDFEALPTGLDTATHTRLRENGLRVIAVPIDQLDQATQSLTPVSTIQTESIGMLYRWSPLIVGPELEEDFTRLDTGPLQLAQGRFRLLARAWIVPDLTQTPETGIVAARLRVELLPQHEQTKRRRFDHLLNPGPGTIDDAGLIFHRLKASIDIPQGHALVIVPASPATEWDTLHSPVPPQTPSISADPADETFGPTEDSDPIDTDRPIARPERPVPNPPAPPPTDVAVGPTAPSLLTIGEKLLRRPAGISDRTAPNGQVLIERERSLVVVLIAHTPARYALLP